MESQYKLTVVTTTYNQEKYIDACKKWHDDKVFIERYKSSNPNTVKVNAIRVKH